MTEWLHFHFSLPCIGKGNGNPLQCSCLVNPRDGGAWWAAIYGVTQSRTWLKQLSSSSSSSFNEDFDFCLTAFSLQSLPTSQVLYPTSKPKFFSPIKPPLHFIFANSLPLEMVHINHSPRGEGELVDWNFGGPLWTVLVFTPLYISLPQIWTDQVTCVEQMLSFQSWSLWCTERFYFCTPGVVHMPSCK